MGWTSRTASRAGSSTSPAHTGALFNADATTNTWNGPLAAKITADAIAASQPDPAYVAFLVEGNDITGLDVGFLIKSAEVAASTDLSSDSADARRKETSSD